MDCRQNNRNKRQRSKAKHSSSPQSAGRAQLQLTNPELLTRLGKKYCDESELLSLMIAHGCIRRVRTFELEVRPLDGSSFKVTINASQPSVGEAKAQIARIQGTQEERQELYKVAASREDGKIVREDDAEPELFDDDRAELAEGDIITLAVKEDFPLVWGIYAKNRVVLTEEGKIATQSGQVGSLVTSGVELVKGSHYWEVELLSEEVGGILIGITRPNLDPTIFHGYAECNDGWLIGSGTGSLCGNGKFNDNPAGTFKQGDRVGVLLDLDTGSLCFFKNGVQHGPGFSDGGVSGPVVHAMLLTAQERSARLLGQRQN
jgi:hypothetical protein